MLLCFDVLRWFDDDDDGGGGHGGGNNDIATWTCDGDGGGN